MTGKDELHVLVDRLPESELRAAQRFLRYLNDTATDRLVRTLENAPMDDEPETPEEKAAVREVRRMLRPVE
ncbi:MAG: hypothetical protein HY675_21940 [Chloroflexi bacterium]|nr:hypothetical protein [Chloroflexota bacterium]